VACSTHEKKINVFGLLAERSELKWPNSSLADSGHGVKLMGRPRLGGRLI
jgi:hypothetical protein